MLIVKHQIKSAKFSDNYYKFKITGKYNCFMCFGIMPKYNAKAHETGIETDKA